VTQEVYIVKKDAKTKLLGKILSQYRGSVLLFSATKSGAGKITRAIRDMGHRAAEIHSDRSLPERRMALDAFKSGRCRILVATDIAARGIDVTQISHVINYDMPDTADAYTHRIGRTGRMARRGAAVSLVTREDLPMVKRIERNLGRVLEHRQLELSQN
jgi:ATP-dependent RNA helicase RhlE